MNVRATNTLDNIEEDNLDEKDPSRKRRGSNPLTDKRREAGTFDAVPCNEPRNHCTAEPVVDKVRYICSKRGASIDCFRSKESVIFVG